jgi:hypothetical protein
VKRPLVILCAASAFVACVGNAQAHEGGAHTGFAARVSVIDPFLPGLLVTVVGGHEQLSVTNLTEKTIVFLDAGDQPFVRVPPGKTEVWSEPRIGASEEPPEEEGHVRDWRIRGTADGEPFEILGFLGYRPPPEAQADQRFPAGGIAAVLVAGALVAAVLVALGRRRAARDA